MNQANELEDRLIDFAVGIINLVDALPDSPAAKSAKEKLSNEKTGLLMKTGNDN